MSQFKVIITSFALALGVLGCSTNSVSQDATAKTTLASIKKENGGQKVYLPSGQTLFFGPEYNLSEEEMVAMALELESDSSGASYNMDALPEEGASSKTALGKVAIVPGETEDHKVYEGNTDNFYSSTNGFRTFTVWVSDNTTEVYVKWYEETQEGVGNWVFRGSETVKGSDVKKSRTVFLDGRENFKVVVKGIRETPDKPLSYCHYKVSCSFDAYVGSQSYTSTDFANTSTWFQADANVRWYWGGCATWMVVNDFTKEILLVDGYVSKATLGASHDFSAELYQLKRVARFVNIIRQFIAKGYSVEGALITHRHGDHMGDLPYILGGIRTENKANFLGTGIALKGAGYQGTGYGGNMEIPVYMSNGSSSDPYYIKSTYDSLWMKPTYVMKTTLHAGYIDGKDFAVGEVFYLGGFQITPYSWYHGTIGDGEFIGISFDPLVRTIAFTIQGKETNSAKVFYTAGYVEKDDDVDHIISNIDAHHVIFADGGSLETARSAQTINILASSPVGYNYIFNHHNDNNSNTDDMDDRRQKVERLFGRFMQEGIVTIENGSEKWRGNARNIKLGYFTNRLGDACLTSIALEATSFVPDSSAKLRWSFNTLDNAVFPEYYTSNRNAIALHATATTSALGRNGNAANFTGSDYVAIQNSPSLNFGTGDFTLSFWIKTSDDYKAILDKRDAGTGVGYHVYIFNGVPLLQLAGPNGYLNFYNASGTKINDGFWHKVVITVARNSTTGGKIYVDGVLSHPFDPKISLGSITNSSPLFVGRHKDGATLKGQIDDFFLASSVVPLANTP